MKVKALIFCLAMVASAGSFSAALAYEDGEAANAAAEANNENSNSLNQGIWYAPSSSYDNNVTIGSMPTAIGASAQLQDYRPGYLNNQAVEAPLNNLVKYGPKVVTREMLETAKVGTTDRKGNQVYEKEIWKNMVIRDGIYYRKIPEDYVDPVFAGRDLKVSDQVRQIMLGEFPKDAIEGQDYLWLGPIIVVSRSKDELIFVHNLRDGAIEKAMDRGANAIIFEGQGADRDIKSGSFAANFWTSLAQIFTYSNPYSAAIAPGISGQSGTTSEITKPFVGGIGIFVTNWEKFNKVHAKKAPDENQALAELKKETDLTEDLLEKCKTYSMNNLTLRNQQGKNYLKNAFINRSAGRNESASKALKIAEHHFMMAEKNYAVVKNNKDDDQAEAKKFYNDSIYWRAGVIQVLQGEQAAFRYAQTHGLERIPTFK